MLAELFATAVIAGVVSWIATWGAARLAHRMAVLDRPGGYKQHAAPMPLLGGLGVAAGSLVAMLFVLREESGVDVIRLAALGFGAVIILIAGLLDDIRGLSPRHKLAWQVGAAAAAALCLAVLGIRLDLFLQWPPVPIMLLTALWVVVIANAVNFLDNTDGLCAGVGAIGGCALVAINVRQGEPIVALAAAALSGACLGFLPHNWPRARVFLGDTGAMFIGFLLAALSVMGVYTRVARVPGLAVLAPLCVLAIPVMDAVLVVILRLLVGHPPWLGDRRHLNHRLMQRGFRATTAVAILWVVSAAGGLVGLLLPTASIPQALLLLGLFACVLAGLAVAAGARGLP